MKNELKKLPFTITRLVVPYMMILQIAGVVGQNSFDNHKLLSFIAYCGVMIWFSHEASLMACTRFEDDDIYGWDNCSFGNKLHFWFSALLYIVCIPVSVFYGKNFLAFIIMIIAWSNIGYANDCDFKLNADNLVSGVLIVSVVYGYSDIFKGEFAIMGVWGYFVAFFAAICVVFIVLGNIDNPEFEEAE